MLNLNRIDFMLDVVINSLTFVFTNGMRSPPAESYSIKNSSNTFNAEPSHKYELPSDVAIGALEFGTNEYNRLNSIAIHDQAGNVIHTIKGSRKSTSTKALKLKPNEQIVSAQVEKLNESPVNVSFILYISN